jgi:hypothetical protein
MHWSTGSSTWAQGLMDLGSNLVRNLHIMYPHLVLSFTSIHSKQSTWIMVNKAEKIPAPSVPPMWCPCGYG